MAQGHMPPPPSSAKISISPPPSPFGAYIINEWSRSIVKTFWVLGIRTHDLLLRIWVHCRNILAVQLKVRKFQKQIFLFSFETNTERNYFLISALRIKNGSNKIQCLYCKVRVHNFTLLY